MNTVSVVYRRTGRDDRFDFDYYTAKHLSMVRSLWSAEGLTDIVCARGVAGPDGGEADAFAITLIRFSTAEGCARAMASEGTAGLMADIANFTNVTPALQLGDTIDV